MCYTLYTMLFKILKVRICRASTTKLFSGEIRESFWSDIPLVVDVDCAGVQDSRDSVQNSSQLNPLSSWPISGIVHARRRTSRRGTQPVFIKRIAMSAGSRSLVAQFPSSFIIPSFTRLFAPPSTTYSIFLRTIFSFRSHRDRALITERSQTLIAFASECRRANWPPGKIDWRPRWRSNSFRSTQTGFFKFRSIRYFC